MAIMIIASPGRWRDGLQAMLASFLQEEPLIAGDDLAATLEAICTLRPDLVILDSKLFGAETDAVVRDIKSRCACTACIVVVDRITHSQTMRDAGADCILLTGFPTITLFDAVEQLLLRRNLDDGK
ncbi:MAG: hypothetical protein ACFLMY_16250 [Candidatus Brachytrichaceae bacterium NZ_4S206]|jgi:DNA-binding NarL/FixJ family response regulator